MNASMMFSAAELLTSPWHMRSLAVVRHHLVLKSLQQSQTATKQLQAQNPIKHMLEIAVSLMPHQCARARELLSARLLLEQMKDELTV